MKLALDLTGLAALRSVVGHAEPDPIEVALIAVRAGADVIGVHMKSDRNHLTEKDCLLLRDVIRAPLYLKISTSTELVKFAVSMKPSAVVLLPERREDLPLEDGVDVILNQSQVKKAQSMLREAGITVFVFIHASIDQVKVCHKLDVEGVQLNTLKYCESGREEDLLAVREAARLARKLGMQAAAGRGLHRKTFPMVAAIPELDEIHIGRLFTARAILEGSEGAAAGLKQDIERARARVQEV